MDCQITDAALIDFHFAASTEDTAALWETHLKSCPDCLSRYFTMKRAIDFSGQSPLRPSHAVRANILSEYARFFDVMSRSWQPRVKKMFIGVLAAAALVFGIVSVEVAFKDFAFSDSVFNDLVIKGMSREAAPPAAEAIDAGGSQTAHSHIL